VAHFAAVVLGEDDDDMVSADDRPDGSDTASATIASASDGMLLGSLSGFSKSHFAFSAGGRLFQAALMILVTSC
jgi:hypothetical protein